MGRRGTVANEFVAGGWPRLQIALLWWPGSLFPNDSHQRLRWRVALTEALGFAKAGFDIGWCQHGKHWYVRGDKRQKDCPPHSKAGEQARWRERRHHREREVARLRTLVANKHARLVIRQGR